MFSNNDNYDLDSAQNKVDNAKRLINLQIQIKTLENVLIAKGIISELDLNATKQYVMNNEEIKYYMQQLKAVEDKITQYKNNPEQHLRDLLNAKMNGTIK